MGAREREGSFQIMGICLALLLLAFCSQLIFSFFPWSDQSSAIQFFTKSKHFDGSVIGRETEVMDSERILGIGDSTTCDLCPPLSCPILDHMSSVLQFSYKDKVSFAEYNKLSICGTIWRWECMDSCISSSADYAPEQEGTCNLTSGAIYILFTPTLIGLVVSVYRRTRRVNKMAVDATGCRSTSVDAGDMISKAGMQTFFCKVCLETKPLDHSFRSEHCIHLFCTECVAENAATNIRENSAIIRCMEIGCSAKTEIESCREILTSELFERWALLLLKSFIFSHKNIYCPFADCNALLWDNRKELGKKVLRQAECPHCRRLVCAHCNVGWHAGMSCHRFQKTRRRNLGKNESKMKDLAYEKNWRRCPNCKLYVEKLSGCVHMTCRCGFEFCYVCGTSWSDYKHKCKWKRLLKSLASWSAWRGILRTQLH